jgi:hypothetical protein
MSSKNKITLILFIIVASASLWLYLHNTKSTIREELYDFAVEDTASITKIYMVNTNGKQVLLERESASSWKVNKKYKARPDAIKNLLVCIKDLQVRNPVAKSAIENVSKQLATSSTKVEIYQKNKLVKMYYVGGDTQDGLGTFMLLTDVKTGKNSITPFVMFIPGFNGFLSVRYFLDEDEWRDRTVFNFYPDQISSITVYYTHFPDSGFTLTLHNINSISLSDSKGNNIPVFDTLKAKRYITYYTNIQYEALRNKMRPSFRDSVLAKGPVHIITLKDKNGVSHIVKTFSKPADPNKIDETTGKPAIEDTERMFALINDDKDIALIQYFVFGKLFQNISYFKKFPEQNK